MNTTSAEFFEQMYRESDDPWRFASSRYELSRYDSILLALSHRRYRHAFEPACSIGVLTEKLSSICDFLEATDISATASELARQRCASLPNVEVRCGSLPQDIPASFDLLVLSEVGYYFTREEFRGVVRLCLSNLVENGTLVACHWLGSSPDHILSGDETHAVIAAMSELHLEHSERHPDFRLDRWRKIADERLSEVSQ
jgi:hypothetical protein